MIYTPLTKKALKISFKVHKDQVDKAGLPYIFHPFYLANKMDDEYSICVALLHDVIEDGNYTVEDLIKEGFPSEVVEAVKLLTHLKEDSYFDYINKMKLNSLARKVKIEDLKHNLDLSRLNEITNKDLERIEKYKKAIFILEN